MVIFSIVMLVITKVYGGFLSHGDHGGAINPIHLFHSFLKKKIIYVDLIFHEINQPAIGVPPFQET